LSLSAAAIDALVKAGVSAEQLAAAVKAELAADEARRAAARTGAAARQRRKRARDRGEGDLAPADGFPSDPAAGRVTRDSGDSAAGGVTTRDPSQGKEVSPRPPSRKPNPPGDNTPHTDASREGDSREAQIFAETAKPADPFARFWAAYPRKVGRPVAERAFAKAIRRAGGPDPPAAILAGLHRQLSGWARREAELIPHPTTWLNRDGWNDDPDSPRPIHARHPANDLDPGAPRRTSAGAHRQTRLGRSVAGALAFLDEAAPVLRGGGRDEAG
jgi:hypothetical protein